MALVFAITTQLRFARVRGKKSDQAKRATTLAPVCETNLYYRGRSCGKINPAKKEENYSKKERNRSSTKICGMRFSMLGNVTFAGDRPRTREVHDVNGFSLAYTMLEVEMQKRVVTKCTG